MGDVRKVDVDEWLAGKRKPGEKARAPVVEKLDSRVTPEMIDNALDDVAGAGREVTAHAKKAADAIDRMAAEIGLSGPTFVAMVKMLTKTDRHGNDVSEEKVRLVLEGLFRFREHLR